MYWGPDPFKSTAEWFGGGTAKVIAVKAMASASETSVITLSGGEGGTKVASWLVDKYLFGWTAKAAEAMAGSVGPVTIVDATIADIAKHLSCANAHLPINVPDHVGNGDIGNYGVTYQGMNYQW
jgi:hypothetical protein